MYPIPPAVFTITPTFSICPGVVIYPVSSRPVSVAGVNARSIQGGGYLRPVKQWNKGKKEEFRERKTYHVEHCQSKS